MLCRYRLKVLALRRHIHHDQSVFDAVQETRARLRRLPTAHNDAKALVANALQPPLATINDVYFHDERQLTKLEAAALDSSLSRRMKGEPLAHITGRKGFWSLEFNVSKDTLIPRSDSEVLIEALVDQFSSETPLRILDIGTGSGCLLLSALSEFPHATGVGIDICPKALAIAKQNALSTRLAARAEFLLRDLSELAAPQNELTDDKTLYRKFDVILCNPPYIPRRELDLVGPDVLKFEPHLALFADGGFDDSEVDPDGLRLYHMLHRCVAKFFRRDARKISAAANLQSLTSKCLVVEIGSKHQAQAVQTLFSKDLNSDSLEIDCSNGLQLQLERFLFDANGKHRGLLFLAP